MYPTFLRLQLANSAAAVFLPVPYALRNPACDFGLFPGAPRGLAPQLASTTKTFLAHALLRRPGTINFLDLQNNSSCTAKQCLQYYGIFHVLPLGKNPTPPAVFFSGRFLAKYPLNSLVLSRPEENT